MAKGAYIGINNTAHKIKKGYIGILTNQSGEVETTITTDNINSYFTVTNGEYTFVGSGSIFTTTEEARANTSTITLTALEAFSISFEYTIYSHFAQNDSFSITVAGTTVVDILCNDVSMPYTKSWSGSVNTGDAITITLTQSGRVYTGNDLKASFQKMIITQNVSKPAAEVARKIKKAYIGIGGIARPCWGGGELAYYGTITTLSAARYGLAATTVGNYALFGGGRASSTRDTVDVYDKSLVRSTAEALAKATYYLSATTIGNYALFGGGESSSSVTAYTSGLTKSTPDSLYVRSGGCSGNAATAIGNYALFAGGYYDSYNGGVTAYDMSLTRSIPTAMSDSKYLLAATTVGGYALFGGGNGLSNVVDAYDESLTMSTITPLQTAKQELKATSLGDFAIFAGGRGGNTSTHYSDVDVYDTSLTKTNPTSLSQARSRHAATPIGDYALFGGGYTGSNSNVVDAYALV